MIDKEILLLKVEQLEFTSEKIESFLEKYHKDSTDDIRVRIADYVNDRSIFFTVGELKLAVKLLKEKMRLNNNEF